MTAVEDPRRRGRRRALRTVTVVLLVVGVITGGPWVYARFFAPEAPDPLAVSATMTTAPPPPVLGPVDPAGSWTVAEGSEAGYRLGEVLSGQEVTVVGRTEQVSGELTVEGETLTAARVVVDVESITTPESARDAYFRRALDTSTYPEAIFELTTPVDVAAVGEPGQDVPVEVVGVLTMHGTSVPTTVRAVARRTDGGLQIVGSASVTLSDFGLTAPDLPFVTVEPTGTVEVLLELRK